MGRGSRRRILGPSAPGPFAPPLLLFCPLLLYRPQPLCFSTAPPALPLRPCSAAPLICGERRLEPGAGPLGFLCWSPGPRRPCWSTMPALSYGQVISSALFSATHFLPAYSHSGAGGKRGSPIAGARGAKYIFPVSYIRTDRPISIFHVLYISTDRAIYNFPVCTTSTDRVIHNFPVCIPITDRVIHFPMSYSTTDRIIYDFPVCT